MHVWLWQHANCYNEIMLCWTRQVENGGFKTQEIYWSFAGARNFWWVAKAWAKQYIDRRDRGTQWATSVSIMDTYTKLFNSKMSIIRLVLLKIIKKSQSDNQKHSSIFIKFESDKRRKL